MKTFGQSQSYEVIMHSCAYCSISVFIDVWISFEHSTTELIPLFHVARDFAHYTLGTTDPSLVAGTGVLKEIQYMFELLCSFSCGAQPFVCVSATL